MPVNVVDVFKKIVDNKLEALTMSDMVLGSVKSIDPLIVTVIDGQMEVHDDNLILTESVLRKKFSVSAHIHTFDKDYFKHNHGSPLQGVTGDLTVVVTGQAVYTPAGSSVKLGGGTQSKDLTGTLETLENEEPTKSTHQIWFNGEIVPLEEDPEDSEKFWVILNPGLLKGDGVVMMSVKNGQYFIILSKLYGSYEYEGDA